MNERETDESDSPSSFHACSDLWLLYRNMSCKDAAHLKDVTYTVRCEDELFLGERVRVNFG